MCVIYLEYLPYLFSAKSREVNIIRNLFADYDPQAFPLDDDKSVVVNVSYFLMQLQGLVSIFYNFY